MNRDGIPCGRLRLLLAVACALALVRQAAALPLTNVVFVTFDVETTGLSASKDRIVEIAATRFRNGVLGERKAWLVNPGVPIPAKVQAVHGITDAMMADKPPFRTVFPEFEAFAGDAVLVAHNATFDVGFIRAEARRNEMPAPTNAVLDSLPLTRHWFPDEPSHALRALADSSLKIDAEPVHRAQCDSDYLALIFLAGLRTMPDTTTVADLERLAGRRLRLTPPRPRPTR